MSLETDSTNVIDESSLSSNVAVLDAPLNGKVYIVGTAHFSIESQKEVADLIRKFQPNRVVLELCASRTNILKYDEQTLLKEAKEMNMNKLIQSIKEVNEMRIKIIQLDK